MTRDFIHAAIEGAFRDAKNAHPEWHFPKSLAQSIAKRASGTIAAQARLAAPVVPSEREAVMIRDSQQGRGIRVSMPRPTFKRAKGIIHVLHVRAFRLGKTDDAQRLREIGRMMREAEKAMK